MEKVAGEQRPRLGCDPPRGDKQTVEVSLLKTAKDSEQFKLFLATRGGYTAAASAAPAGHLRRAHGDGRRRRALAAGS